MSDAALPAASPPAMRGRAVRASGIWAATYALLQVIRIGSQVLLAQMLAPQAFGVVRLANAIVQGARMCSEVGIRESIVRSERGDDPRFLNTAWTIQILRGIVLWIISAALAWPASIFFEESSLMLILPATALVALITGFASTTLIQLNRTLREGPRAALELLQAIVTRGTMLLWAALISPTAWSLVIGSIAGAIVYVLVSHAIPGHRNRLAWDRDAAGQILRFGTWILIGTIIAFLGQQADSLLLGKLDELAVLGVYGIALTVSTLPVELANVISQHILFPLLSDSARADARAFSRRLLRARAVILRVGLLLCVGVVVASPLFFELLFKPAYHAAIWIAPLTCLTSWARLLNASANRALLAMGQTKRLAASGAVRVACSIALSILGYSIGATPSHALGGFIVGTAIGTLAGHLYDVRMLARAGINLLPQDLAYTLIAVAIAVPAFLADRLLAASIPPGTDQILARAAVGVAIAGALTLASARSVLKEIRR